MKIKFQISVALISIILSASCSVENNAVVNQISSRNLKYLALGDSYTYGQSVCGTCRFPEQLKDSISKRLNSNDVFSLKLIAQTGWTTTNLKTAITSENLSNNYNLVTLLIGVNNQYQNKPFTLFEQEFPELILKATTLAKGNKDNLIVVSIPDYAYTPYGQGSSNPQNISTQIDMYNTFTENYCLQNNITFVNITDITREGLENPSLVAGDGLHPSETAYSRFVERILPLAKLKLGL